MCNASAVKAQLSVGPAALPVGAQSKYFALAYNVPAGRKANIDNTHAIKFKGLQGLIPRGFNRGRKRPSMHGSQPLISHASASLANVPVLLSAGVLEVVALFKEAASGTKSNRAARNQIMELAQARKIDAVHVTELSR